MDVSSAGDYDLIYVFREAALLGPAWFERRMARSDVPMVFDFDDAVFLAYKSPSGCWPKSGEFYAQVDGCFSTRRTRKVFICRSGMLTCDFAARTWLWF